MSLSRKQLWFKRLILGAAAIAPWATLGLVTQSSVHGADVWRPAYQVIAYNDLGMHCMNEDFSELCILPPFNNLRVQVIRRGNDPDVMDGDFTLNYSIPGNTVSTNKTNFWQYSNQLFGVNLPPNTGLTGNSLSGNMSINSQMKYWEVTGVPVTPLMDDMSPNAYPLAKITARRGTFTGQTMTVIPVSWEISCNLCHLPEPGQSVAHDILADHDRLHGTNLVNQKPVLCASCHADPALGTPGTPGVPTMSGAMHSAHANRMGKISLKNECYACHPGIETDCQRDVHKSNGVVCTTCHGGMVAVGSSTRTPWVDQPKCSNCHNVQGHDYEEPGKLFKDSRGHGGVMCAVCHGSPHVIAPATNMADNIQAMRLQGRTGTLRECKVCHTTRPSGNFPHKFDD